MPVPGLIASTPMVDSPGQAPKAVSAKPVAWVLPDGWTDKPLAGLGYSGGT